MGISGIDLFGLNIPQGSRASLSFSALEEGSPNLFKMFIGGIPHKGVAVSRMNQTELGSKAG